MKKYTFLFAIMIVIFGFSVTVAADPLTSAGAYGDGSSAFTEIIARLWQWLREALTNPVVGCCLLIPGLIAIIMEFAGFGDGFPGIIGIAAVFLFFVGRVWANTAILPITVLFVLGVFTLILEFVAFPGTGVFAVSGLVMLLIALFALSPAPYAYITIGATILAIIIIIGLGVKNMKMKKILKKMVLDDSTSAEKGYTSPNMDNQKFLGKEGVACSLLRPAGVIDIDGERVDVVTEGMFLAEGTKVKVVGLDGTRIVVRAVKEN